MVPAFFNCLLSSHAVLQTLLAFTLVADTALAARPPTSRDEVRFDHPGGFCQAAFTLTLTTPAGQGVIYYTTNGEEPLPANGNLYVRPLEIAATTIVRAAAVQTGTNLVGTGAEYFFVRLKHPDANGESISKCLGCHTREK